MPAPVSVVIPVRNRETRVLNAIRSVIAQTLPPREIIVVDDGSTDRTADVVLSHSGSAVALKLIRLPATRGAQAARNAGILAASAKWIAFLDSDDEWLPESLRLRLSTAEESEADVVHSECLVRRPGTEEPVPFNVPPLSGDVYRDLLRRPGPMFQGMLVKGSVLEAIGGLDERLIAFQEWDTSIRLARLATFAFVAEPTFVYDCTQADSISKNFRRSADGYRMVVAKHRWAILTRLGPKALSDHWTSLAGLYIEAGDARRTRFWLTAAGLLWPFHPRFLVSRVVPLWRGRGGPEA